MPRPPQYTPRLASSKLDAVLRVLSFIFNERAKKKMYENFAAAFFAALPFLCVIFIQRGVCGMKGGRELARGTGESGFVTYYFGAGFI